MMGGSFVPMLFCCSCEAHWEHRSALERGNDRWATQARERGAPTQAIWDAAFADAQSPHCPDKVLMAGHLFNLTDHVPPETEPRHDQLMLFIGLHDQQLMGPATDRRWGHLDNALRRRHELRLALRVEAELLRTTRRWGLPYDHIRRIAQMYRLSNPTYTEARIAFLRELASDAESVARLAWNNSTLHVIWNELLPPNREVQLVDARSILADPLWRGAGALLRKLVINRLIVDLAQSWVHRPAEHDLEMAQQLFDWSQELPVEQRPLVVHQLLQGRDRAVRLTQCVEALLDVTTGADNRQALLAQALEMLRRATLVAPVYPNRQMAVSDPRLLERLEREGLVLEVAAFRAAVPQ
jgi:hypothetical protein